MRRSRPWLVAIILAVAAVPWLSGVTLAADHSVSISGFAFHPPTVTIRVGDRVTWTNDDTTAHSATATGVLTFNSEDLDPGASFTAPFPTAGSYEYICAIHPTMVGLVVVRPGSRSPPPTDTEVIAPHPDRQGDIVALTLAFLGSAMLAGTVVSRWRLRRRP